MKYSICLSSTGSSKRHRKGDSFQEVGKTVGLDVVQTTASAGKWKKGRGKGDSLLSSMSPARSGICHSSTKSPLGPSASYVYSTSPSLYFLELDKQLYFEWERNVWLKILHFYGTFLLDLTALKNKIVCLVLKKCFWVFHTTSRKYVQRLSF